MAIRAILPEILVFFIFNQPQYFMLQ